MEKLTEWVRGPLGEPATPDWVYWCPETPEGKYRAWFVPNGLPSAVDKLLGEFATLDEAKAACDQHALKTPKVSS